jgi:hypothetical protein
MSDPHADLKKRVAIVPPPEVRVGLSKKERRRRDQFVMVPWAWIEKLDGATGQTYRVALVLLYEHWRRRGEPMKLNNRMVENCSISRQSKWRALADLERRGLIAVQRRSKRSPMVRVLRC